MMAHRTKRFGDDYQESRWWASVAVAKRLRQRIANPPFASSESGQRLFRFSPVYPRLQFSAFFIS